jgi:hypothetical protein
MTQKSIASVNGHEWETRNDIARCMQGKTLLSGKELQVRIGSKGDFYEVLILIMNFEENSWSTEAWYGFSLDTIWNAASE